MNKVAAISSKADWRGRDMRQTEDWIYRISSDEIREIDAALKYAKSKGLSGIQVARRDFPLPTFAATIDKITDELANGRGFILIRGFPAQDYSKEDVGTIFWGLGTHIGADDMGAFFGKPVRCRPADTGAGADDQRDMPGKLLLGRHPL